MISDVYTEILMSICYLHHRGFDLDDLVIFSCKLAERLSRPDHSSTSYDAAITQQMIDLWFKAFRLYIARNPTSSALLERHLDDMKAMAATHTISRFQNRLEEIRSCFPRIIEEHGRNTPITIDRADDAILFQQEDFEYPFGASWFELMYIQSKLGLGQHRLEMMTKDINEKGFSFQLARICPTIIDRFQRDLRENLLPAIGEVDARLGRDIIIKDDFIDSTANILTDYIVASAISYYNYAVAYTDMVSGTTIQLRAIRTIWLQISSTYIIPLTEKQLQFLTDVVTHAIKYGSGK
jgi:hypothetical protein